LASGFPDFRRVGVYLTARLRQGLDDAAIAQAALAGGVVVRPMSKFYLTAPPMRALLLGFTGFDTKLLQAGVDLFATLLREHCQIRPSSHIDEE
jgi:GntR family transcriptional regulator / MocR family aminotransferase